MKQRHLVGFREIEEIVSAVQHQNRNPNPRRKVDFVDLRRLWFRRESAGGQYTGLDPALLSENDHTQAGAIANAI